MKNIIIIILMFITVILPSPAYAQQATLSLSPSSGTFNKSCPFSLQILLNSGGGQVDGVDAILIYDTSRFSATSINNGTLFSDYPGTNIDESISKVTISGTAAVGKPYSGQGILATVNFVVKDTAPVGATQIKFDFDPNDKTNTRDSNVVAPGVIEILNSVVNGNYTIGSGTCASPSPSPRGVGAPGPGINATPSAQPKTLDQIVDKTGNGGGTPELTFTIVIIGSALTILGILGLALL